MPPACFTLSPKPDSKPIHRFRTNCHEPVKWAQLVLAPVANCVEHAVLHEWPPLQVQPMFLYAACVGETGNSGAGNRCVLRQWQGRRHGMVDMV